MKDLKIKRRPKLTKNMLTQIEWCLDYIEINGCYYGKRDNFKQRLIKIREWLFWLEKLAEEKSCQEK